MKILFTVEYYWPQVGGAQKVVQQVAEGLVAHGHQVDVATSEDVNRTQLMLNGVNILPFHIRGNSVKGMRGDIAGVEALLLNNKYDIIVNYAAQTWHSDITFRHLKNIRAKTVFIPCGFSGLVTPLRKLVYFFYYRKMKEYLRQYDHIILHSADYLDGQYCRRHHITNVSVIPNGTEDFNTCNQGYFKEKYRVDTPFMLLSVANHYRDKGHAFIIDAFRRLNRTDVSLVIIGNDPGGRTSCYAKCIKQQKNSSNLKLLSHVPREDVIAAYKESNAFVFGSAIECFPLVILESMANRLPFVSTDVGNVKELEGGIIVSTPAEMAATTNGLLSNLDYAENLGKTGYENWDSHYRWDIVIDNYEQCFSEIIHQQ